MEKVLVVGASGQLGGAVMDQLLDAGYDGIAFIRKTSDFKLSPDKPLEIRYGDLGDFSTVDSACAGVDKVIATASSIVPRKNDRFAVNEIIHYQNLIKACRQQNVKQLVYISAFTSEYDKNVPEFVVKREIEKLIIDSGITYTIFRAAAFMDIYYAVMGSRLVMADVSRPTLLRGFWLTKLYSKLAVGLLEDHGLALLPGNGHAKHAFISIRDVAAFLVKSLAINSAKNRIMELGGPKSLSWREVTDIYAQVLGKKIIKLPIPVFLLNLCAMVLRPFSPAGGNILSILCLLGRYDYKVEMGPLCDEFGLCIYDTREYLEAKLKTCRPE